MAKPGTASLSKEGAGPVRRRGGGRRGWGQMGVSGRWIPGPPPPGPVQNPCCCEATPTPTRDPALREHSDEDHLYLSAQSLQSCPTLCDPVDCSPPGFSIHVDSPGKNTGVGHHALLQGIFPT